MSPDQEHNQHPPPSFWDFIPGFAQNRPGNGVDHHNPQPTPQFSGGFPFGGPWHHGPPPPPHHGGPPHRPPPPGVGHGPWEADFDWGQWYGHDHDHDHDRHGRHSRRRGCRHRGRHHRHCDEGSDEEAQRSSAEKEAPEKGEKGDSPETMDADMPDPEEVAPSDGEHPPPPYGAGRRAGRFHRGGHGWRRGGGGRGHHGGWAPRHCPRGSSFDFPSMMRGFMNHPFFQSVRDQAERHRANDADADAFQPPVDIFTTESSYVVHVALPGAKKDDIGVNWNPDTNTLSVAGVVHRPGDEAFLQGLVSAERRVGVFERNITLPPAGVADKDSVDGLGITARMEDGVLVVVVPKLEREWTEVRKVDVQ
ncbi:Hsp20/alpha crystallin family protein [Metarhizium robertsii]|uniref:Hsp20/alpha crystallin family protein n=1 Tax=Metarhizium robertsii TaxID=568076 RepID=A0A0A1UY57_9HYPO|nr:Hsp20/alpha crystallin family protein [Metarhizium robertsii]